MFVDQLNILSSRSLLEIDTSLDNVTFLKGLLTATFGLSFFRSKRSQIFENYKHIL
jgi:hypothetical protein